MAKKSDDKAKKDLEDYKKKKGSYPKLSKRERLPEGTEIPDDSEPPMDFTIPRSTSTPSQIPDVPLAPLPPYRNPSSLGDSVDIRNLIGPTPPMATPTSTPNASSLLQRSPSNLGDSMDIRSLLGITPAPTSTPTPTPNFMQTRSPSGIGETPEYLHMFDNASRSTEIPQSLPARRGEMTPEEIEELKRLNQMETPTPSPTPSAILFPRTRKTLG